LSDIRLTWDTQKGGADFSIVDNDLETDATFETAVVLSLFTDRRVGAEDTLPPEETERRGWWADPLSPIEGDQIGSRLWLLAREKESPKIVVRAGEYAREALEWMAQDGVAERVDVEPSVLQKGVLLLVITIHRPKVDPILFRFNYNWLAQEARRA
jgi:phage gp46-like protein